jgi:hypothetical protein
MSYGFAKEGRPLARIEPLVKHSGPRHRLFEAQWGREWYPTPWLRARPVLPLICPPDTESL